MVKAAAEKGCFEERAAVLEIMTSLKRAGADLIVTYWARGTRGMDAAVSSSRGETEAHHRLKRLAVCFGRRRNGYSACAVEVSLPQCRLSRRCRRLSRLDRE